MNLSDFAIKTLVPYIIENKRGSELVSLFYNFGARDIYDEYGLPDIKKLNKQRPSKKEHTFTKLKELRGKHELRELIELYANENPNLIDKLNEILNPEKFQVVNQDGLYVVMSGIIDRRKPVVNEAHFQDIQRKILMQLDKARVSIRVVMAWLLGKKFILELDGLPKPLKYANNN